MIKNRLIIYDITDPKRLAKIAKVMENYGVRVQKSVFEVFSNDSTFRSLRTDVIEIMKNEDSVIFFELCQRDWEKVEKFGPGKYIESEDREFYIL